tara:strand:+ start:11 stop:901 length:891 start_codon:yes stop_codon:yes gene_type:complete
MINKKNIDRPDWTKLIKNKKIDLTKNVHHDRLLNDKIKDVIASTDFLVNYANDYDLYVSICNYYKIPIRGTAIGFGATDLIYRVLNSIEIDCLYIVSPSFMMVDVYCKMIGMKYKFIELSEINNLKDVNNSGVYFVNPNGVNGEAHDLREYKDKFKWFIVDEVYSDFYDTHSLINEISDNTVIIKSISKSLGFAGLRVGFCCGSLELINEVQKYRMSQITTSIASLVIPKIINMTPQVVERMLETKNYLENKFDCKKSLSNYVLFKNKNIYTEKFGAKFIEGHYRMALADMDTLNG